MKLKFDNKSEIEKEQVDEGKSNNLENSEKKNIWKDILEEIPEVNRNKAKIPWNKIVPINEGTNLPPIGNNPSYIIKALDEFEESDNS